MQKKIVILSSGHPPFDERIFWKFGRTLTNHGFEVVICTSTEDLNVQKEKITIDSFNAKDMNKKEKVNRFTTILNRYKPALIICCEPLPLLSAAAYRKNHKNTAVVSDITEWYPGPNALAEYSGLRKCIKYLKLFLFNIYSSNLADHLIIGEENKAALYSYITPLKKKTIIGYYPPAELFRYYPVNFNGKELTLCFTGLLTKERGFNRFVELGKTAARKYPDVHFHLSITGKYMNEQDMDIIKGAEEIPNLSLAEQDWVSYDKFGEQIGACDICIDLRDKNRYYDKAIPIKIFDYMAAGKPVIYSNISSLGHIPELKTFGNVVEPDDINGAADIIISYIRSPEKLKEHSLNARKAFEEKYSWEKLEPVLLKLVNELI